MTIQDAAAKLALLKEIYHFVEESVESFEHNDLVGPDLAYLLGAILKESCCAWPPRRRIIQLLQDNFAHTHPVWTYLCISKDFD